MQPSLLSRSPPGAPRSRTTMGHFSDCVLSTLYQPGWDLTIIHRPLVSRSGWPTESSRRSFRPQHLRTSPGGNVSREVDSRSSRSSLYLNHPGGALAYRVRGRRGFCLRRPTMRSAIALRRASRGFREGAPRSYSTRIHPRNCRRRGGPATAAVRGIASANGIRRLCCPSQAQDDRLTHSRYPRRGAEGVAATIPPRETTVDVSPA